ALAICLSLSFDIDTCNHVCSTVHPAFCALCTPWMHTCLCVCVCVCVCVCLSLSDTHTHTEIVPLSSAYKILPQIKMKGDRYSNECVPVRVRVRVRVCVCVRLCVCVVCENLCL